MEGLWLQRKGALHIHDLLGHHSVKVLVQIVAPKIRNFYKTKLLNRLALERDLQDIEDTPYLCIRHETVRTECKI
jgi:hypothetical protein